MRYKIASGLDQSVDTNYTSLGVISYDTTAYQSNTIDVGSSININAGDCIALVIKEMSGSGTRLIGNALIMYDIT